MKRCPFCAEEIQDAAVVCRHCGRELPPEGDEGPEQRLWVGRPGLLSHFWKVTAGLLLILGASGIVLLAPSLAAVAVAALAMGFGLLAAALIGVLRFRYEVTTERAIARQGLLSQSTSEIQLDDVRNVLVQRGLADRLLGLGTVSLSTAGQSGLEITFRSIREPQAVVRLVNEHNR